MSAAVEAVGVVGTGAVGQAVTTALISSALSARLLITSRTHRQAAALAADLDDMRTATDTAVRPYACRTRDLLVCEAIVVALRADFTNTNIGDVRMGGAHANAPAVRALGVALRGYTGTVLVVTNPVDLMTRLLAETSGCDRVFGIGSNLDSARYRLAVAQLLDVRPSAIRGHVIGEHGDAAVVCASTTTIDGKPAHVPIEQIRAELKDRPARINAGIGRTRCGPAGALLTTLRLALGVVDGITELSAPYLDGWLGIPLRFTAGRPTPCLPKLSEAEACSLQVAHTKLRAAYEGLRDEPSNARTL